MASVTAWAPGSVSNLSCGFDVLGFAIEGPGDCVTAARRREPGVGLAEVSGDDGRLPRDAAHNTAGVAAARLLNERGAAGGPGVSLRLEKGMPLASGLGSSAASAVAAVVAVDALFGDPSPPDLLLRCAMEGERAACGTAHADNVAPSLFGGLVLVRGGEAPRVDPLPLRAELWCALVHPRIEVSTREARAKLPASVPTAVAVAQAANLAALVAGLATGDRRLLRGALVDLIAEPVRSDAVPGFAEARAAAVRAGAIGAGLSGSGPTMYALASGRDGAEHAAGAMRKVLSEATGAECDSWISVVGAPGARIL
jgi:homoserine kinase